MKGGKSVPTHLDYPIYHVLYHISNGTLVPKLLNYTIGHMINNVLAQVKNRAIMYKRRSEIKIWIFFLNCEFYSTLPPRHPLLSSCDVTVCHQYSNSGPSTGHVPRTVRRHHSRVGHRRHHRCHRHHLTHCGE